MSKNMKKIIYTKCIVNLKIVIYLKNENNIYTDQKQFYCSS